MMESDETETILEKAMKDVGQDGKFQKLFDVIYNGFVPMCWSMCYMNIILVLTIPPHTCEPPVKPNSISQDLWIKTYIPTIKHVNGRSEFSSCMIYVNPYLHNKTKTCSSYIYDKTWYESTVPSDNNWVCNDEIYVANVYAYSRIGEMIGSVIFGWFGDVYGRRLSYIISLAFVILGRLISVVGSKSYLIFLAGCVIASFPSWTVMQSITVLSLETTSSERRTWSATLRNLSFSIGMCIMPLLFWWLKNWKAFMIVSSGSLVPFLFLSWLIIESPRWLWVEGNVKECIKYLKRIAKINGRKLETDTEKELLNNLPIKENNQNLGPLALFSTWKLGLNTVLQLVMWMSVSMSYTVLLLSFGDKSDGNPFLLFAWQAVADIPGYFVGEWLADRVGRRIAGLTSYGTIAVTWILIIIRESNDWIRSWWMTTIILVISRVSTSVAYYIICLFNMELYPTCLRQSGMALGNVVSSAAGAISPYIVYLGHKVDPRLSAAILTGMSVLGVVCTYLLPETLNAKLPETIEDAKMFGNCKRKYFSVRLKRDNDVSNKICE